MKSIRPLEADAPLAAEADLQKLLQELRIHQVELEMQNEELRVARLETESALARYTEIFEFAPIGYAVLEGDGVIRELNHACARIIGRERARLRRTHFGGIVSTTDRAAFAGLVARIRESRASETCDVALTKPGAAVTIVRLTATALIHASPVVLLAIEDITDQKVREERLTRSEENLRVADQRKNEFLAVLSHELRNPLAPIRTSLAVLDFADPGSERARRAQAIIDRQVTHLARLIDDLLDVTRIARGKIQLQRALVDLREIVLRTVDDHRPSFESSGIDLQCEMDSGFLWVNADSARLVQVVSNLLGNAEKFTPCGGNVSVKLRREGKRVSLRVRDTGAGISRDVLDHLFEPFAQAPQTLERTRGGLGLGLAMVKGLVELHDGVVSIRSDGTGRGTEVEAFLPLEAEPRVDAAPDREPCDVVSRRALVIDDNCDTADSLGDLLELGGHVVRVAHDGPSAIALAREFRPEVVICDIGLPGMDGYEVARTIRSDATLADVYLIALSGYAQPEDRQRAVEAGFDQHLAKPPSTEAIERLVLQAPARKKPGH